MFFLYFLSINIDRRFEFHGTTFVLSKENGDGTVITNGVTGYAVVGIKIES
jgi:hypothetical protein